MNDPALALLDCSLSIAQTSRRVRQRRLTAIVAGWMSGLGGLGVTVLGCILAGSQNSTWKDAVPFVVIGGIVFSAVVSSIIAGIVTPAKITDSHVWLRGVHTDYLGRLSEWPGE